MVRVLLASGAKKNLQDKVGPSFDMLHYPLMWNVAVVSLHLTSTLVRDA
jgi:hypothetical protein